MILGAQFYTLRNFCKTTEGLDESLKKVADMGFTAVQLSGVCEYDPEWAAERCREYGLKIAITHYPYDKIIGDTEGTIEFHKKMDCQYVGLGMIPGAFREGTYEKYLAEVEPAMEKIRAAGLKFMYHNHDCEFAKDPKSGKLYLEDMCDRFSADKMGVTMDTYWVQAGGGDPAQWLEKLAGRTDCVHFKDMVGFIKEDENHKMTRGHRIAPIGEGNMNYDRIIEACLATGVKYGFVELDECHGEDPFDCMKRSREFLVSRYGLN